MCGIIGYIGESKNVGFLIDGLKRLEYRGYDSCGVAVQTDQGVFLKKIRGKINDLKGQLKQIPFSLGIAHTRWATHGIPSVVNAHPHYDCSKNIFLVHNGIIENHQSLKEYLVKKGHVFASQTDTEVIVHLLEHFRAKHSMVKALLETVALLEGSFATVLFHKEEKKLFFAKKHSPLVIGLADKGFVLASDMLAIVPITKNVITVDDAVVGEARFDGFGLFTFQGKAVKAKKEVVRVSAAASSKKGYGHFMLKEIYEQPKVISDIAAVYVNKKGIHFKGLGVEDSFLQKLEKIFIFACGTAYHAGYVAKYFLERHCRIDVELEVSSEARYRALNLSKRDLVVAISQSGETADTLAAVREARKKKIKVIGVCNVLGSTLVKESNGIIHTLAGPEIGVASTKAYTAQVFSLILLALYIARRRKVISGRFLAEYLAEMKKVPEYQRDILQKAKKIKKISAKFSQFGCFLFLGRGINYPSAMEGALKLKEISYIPAEGYPAGEMKHGPIALIDEYRAVVCLVPQDKLYSKMISNMQEIKARKGKILAVVNCGDKEATALADYVITVPRSKFPEITPLLVALPLQLFAYFVAKNLKCEIDQPRNLAKSVTVE
ncbi:MAG: glutamine--fructose-6-phosphate transaminase (isomerizing) [Candidatus Omnitrophota bacterium]